MKEFSLFVEKSHKENGITVIDKARIIGFTINGKPIQCVITDFKIVREKVIEKGEKKDGR